MVKITGPVIALMLLLGMGVAIAQPPLPDLLTQQQKVNVIVNSLKIDRANIYVSFKDAQSSKDLLKSICVYDKLQQIDVAISSVQERLITFNDALQENNSALAEHELNILTLLESRAVQFVIESQQCIGFRSYLNTDKSGTTFKISDVLSESVLDYKISSFIIEPPACSSCFR